MRFLTLLLVSFSFMASAAKELEPRMIAAAANPELISQQLLQKPSSTLTARDLLVLAETQLHLKHQDTALEVINKAIPLADNVYLRGYSYLMKARIYGILFRDTPLAITQLQQAEQILIDQQSIEAKSLYGDVLQNFAQAYNQLGQPHNAMLYAKRSLEVALALHHLDYELRARITIGRLALPNNDYSLAHSQFSQALPLATQLNDLPALASIHFRLGTAFLKIKDTKSALEHFQQALPLYEKLQRKTSYTYVLVYIAETHLVDAETATNSESLQLAKYSLAEALLLAREQDDAYRIGEVTQSYAKVALLENNPQQAISLYTDALQLFRQQKLKTAVNEVSINLAEVLYDNNAVEQAIELLNNIESEIPHSAAFMQHRFHRLTAKIAADQQQWQRAYSSLEHASSKRFEQFSTENKLKFSNIQSAANENNLLKQQLEVAQQYQLANAALQNSLTKRTYTIGALLIGLIIIFLLWRHARQQQNSHPTKISASDWFSFCQQVKHLETRANISLIALQLHNSQQLKLEFGEPSYHHILDGYLQQLSRPQHLASCRHIDTLWLAIEPKTELKQIQQDLVAQFRQLLPSQHNQLPILCMSFNLQQLLKKPWRIKTIRALTQALWLGHSAAAETAKQDNTWLMSLESDSPNACEWSSDAIRRDLLNAISLGHIKLRCNGEVIHPSAASSLIIN
jgi:hypothetical protein